jgi:dihydroflavonol-4-reductase
LITLVTGANGHLGNTLVKKLLIRGRHVRAMVRRTSDLAGLRDGQGRLLPGLEIAYADVLDEPAFAEAMDGCDVVYHTAAVFKAGLDKAGEANLMRTALQGAQNLCDLAASARQKPKILYTSSVVALGCSRNPRYLFDESAWNQDPWDAYADSKVKSEKLARALMEANGLDIVFLLPGAILGPNDFGPTPCSRLLRLALRKPGPFWFEGGFSCCDVEDVAEGHLLAEEKGVRGERYVLAGTNVSVREVLAGAAALRGRRPPWIKAGRTLLALSGLGAKEASRLAGWYGYYSSKKAQDQLGYRFRPVPEILARSKNWYEARGWLPKA